MGQGPLSGLNLFSLLLLIVTVNFVTQVKFVTCRKNAQGQAIFTFK